MQYYKQVRQLTPIPLDEARRRSGRDILLDLRIDKEKRYTDAVLWNNMEHDKAYTEDEVKQIINEKSEVWPYHPRELNLQQIRVFDKKTKEHVIYYALKH